MKIALTAPSYQALTVSAGSFQRALCTLASRRLICSRKDKELAFQLRAKGHLESVVSAGAGEGAGAG
eukprot:747123-Hanusia_phi.AAC.1